MWRSILVVAWCVGCTPVTRRIDNGVDASSPAPDGSMIGVDAAACHNGRVVYLNFEGVSLTQGPSDATQNRAAWLQATAGTAPPYHAGSGTRQGDIATIVSGVTSVLAQFPISVVTSRPAAGPYVMIVFGGTANQVASMYSGAVNQLDCGDSVKSDVAWISDGVAPNQAVVNVAVGAIGFGLGLTATTQPTDCMCSWGNGCTPDTTTACTLSTSIARDPGASATCPGLTSQNEQATFDAAFCQ